MVGCATALRNTAPGSKMSAGLDGGEQLTVVRKPCLVRDGWLLGNSEATYTYSGTQLTTHPWNPTLLDLKKQIEPLSKTAFNSVLLNWYRDGLDSMGWHADNEKELGRNPVIASLNLGASRRFLLRKNEDHTQKMEFLLGHGDLLIMRGETQHFWQHHVPKQKKVLKNRINLTFRTIQ